MTEATVESIEVDYIKRFTIVKIKDYKIEFLENIPNEDIINKSKSN